MFGVTIVRLFNSTSKTATEVIERSDSVPSVKNEKLKEDKLEKDQYVANKDSSVWSIFTHKNSKVKQNSFSIFSKSKDKYLQIVELRNLLGRHLNNDDSDPWRQNSVDMKLLSCNAQLKKLELLFENKFDKANFDILHEDLIASLTNVSKFIEETKRKVIRSVFLYKSGQNRSLILSYEILKALFAKDMDKVSWITTLSRELYGKPQTFKTSDLLHTLNSEVIDVLAELGFLQKMSSTDVFSIHGDLFEISNLEAGLQEVETDISNLPVINEVIDESVSEAFQLRYSIKESVRNRLINKIADLKIKRALVYNLYYRNGNYYYITPEFHPQVAKLSCLFSPLIKHGKALNVTKLSLITDLHERQIYTLKSIGMIEEKDQLFGGAKENEGFFRNNQKYYRFSDEIMAEFFAAIYL